MQTRILNLGKDNQKGMVLKTERAKYTSVMDLKRRKQQILIKLDIDLEQQFLH